VQKADLQPASGERSDGGAVDQKAIRIDDVEHWLYAAAAPETKRIRHSRLSPTYTIPIAREFFTKEPKNTTSLTPYSASRTTPTSSAASAETATAIAFDNTALEILSNVSYEK
jgi:transposase-like protein